MIISCKCAKKLTINLETEIYIKSFDSDESPNTNTGQYASSTTWLEKEFGNQLEVGDVSYRSYLKEGDFFFVPERIPTVSVEFIDDCGADDWDVEITADEDNMRHQYHVLTPSGILEWDERSFLSKGIVVAKDSVLSGIIPDWPAEERMRNEGREWPEGSAVGGCCNWSNLQLECECGNVLGLVEIDCYQFSSITFYRENTELVEA
jgi:hypothetical protein